MHVLALPTSPKHTSSCCTTSGGPSLSFESGMVGAGLEGASLARQALSPRREVLGGVNGGSKRTSQKHPHSHTTVAAPPLRGSNTLRRRRRRRARPRRTRSLTHGHPSGSRSLCGRRHRGRVAELSGGGVALRDEGVLQRLLSRRSVVGVQAEQGADEGDEELVVLWIASRR